MNNRAERGIQEANANPGTSTPALRRVLTAIVLFLAAAASFNGFYSKIAFREGDAARGFQAIVDGSASRPYIYRQLVPSIANLVDRTVPDSVRQRLASLRSDDGRGFYASLFSSPIAQNPTYGFRYLIFYLATFAGAILASYLYYFVCRAEGFAPEVSLTAATLMILLIPYIQTRGGGYYNDFPEAAFIALAVLLARRAPWLWLMPVALLGTLNKETFILVLLALWPLLKQRTGNLYAIVQVFVLELIAGTVYLFNRTRFAGNPGGTVEFHLRDQIAFLAHPSHWLFKFGKVYGVFLPELATLIPALLMGWIIWRAWKRLAPAIRQYGLLTAAMNIPLFFLFCMPGEVRDLSLLFVIVLLSLATTLSRSTGSSLPESIAPHQLSGSTQVSNMELVPSR